MAVQNDCRPCFAAVMGRMQSTLTEGESVVEHGLAGDSTTAGIRSVPYPCHTQRKTGAKSGQ